MTGSRVWLFRLLAITIVPILFLVLLEGVLRIIGFGFPSTFTKKCTVEGGKAYCDNNQFGKLFFPINVAREPRSFAILTPKPANTYRIFVLGGSAAEGDPDPSYGFARILQVMLQNQFPGIRFEVINVAMTAINSHVVYRIAKDIVHHEGDLFIIYMGNNEVVGPFGAGTVFSPLSPNLSLIRGSIWVKSTRIGQLFENLLNRTQGTSSEAKTWGGMEMFLQNQIRSDDPGLEKVYQHFKNNLEDIIKMAQKEGTKTILSTVATNLKNNAPFASLHRKDISIQENEKWEGLYQNGVQLETEGKYTQAVNQYLLAAEIDDQFADLQFRIARSHFSLKNFEEARQRYILARDLDTLRFRADSKINEIIRTTTQKKDIEDLYLLDAEEIFEENAHQGIPGDDFFYEHAHTNFKGNYLLAKGFFNQIEKILPDWVQKGGGNRPLLTEDQAANQLAFTGYDRYRLAYDTLLRTQRPPFSNQMNHLEQESKREGRVKELHQFTQLNALKESSKQYRQTIQASPSDPWLFYNFALLLGNSQNPKGAVELLKLFLRFLPQYYPAHEKLASFLIQDGNFGEAIIHCDEALRINPNFHKSAFTKAFALSNLGKFDEGLKILNDISTLSPEMGVGTYYLMGQIQSQQGKFDKAAEAFQKAIQLNKGSVEKPIPDVYFNLGFSLKQIGISQPAIIAFQKAVVDYEKELKSYPKSTNFYVALGRTFVELGEFKKAVSHFQKAVDLNPNEINLHLNLINALEMEGKYDEGIEATQRAVQIMLNLGQKEEAEKLQGYLKALKTQMSEKK